MTIQITTPAAPRRRLRLSGRTILLLLFLGLPALIYTGVCLAIGLQQRQMLFRTDAVSSSAVGAISGEPVIPGSEAVTITTPDGERLAGWYIPPARGQKVMLFLHGQGGRLAVQSNRWRRVREGGYGLLAFSYRGYAGSTGTPTEEGIALDARAAYDWLRQRHAARDIVVHGHSLGSGVAVRLASEVEVGAVVLESPFTAAVDVAAERFPWLPVRWLMLDQFRSRDRIGAVKAPVLIAHGDSDRVIPFVHAERLYALAQQPKVFLRFPGSDHNTLVRDGLYDRMKSFLASVR